MKKLLIIAYYFPPAAVVGTNRVTRFVKYLPGFNWESIVVTVDENYYDIRDETLVIPDKCSLYRTPMLVIADGHRTYTRTDEGGLRALGLQKKVTTNKLIKTFQTYLSTPDTRSGWIPSAVVQSLRIIRQHKVDAILTTSFPYSAHIVGLIIKSIKGLFWLADFRDPWAEYAFLYPNTHFHHKTAYSLENEVVKNADCVIANTPLARDRFQERYKQHLEKIQSIPNGFDLAEIEEVRSTLHNDIEDEFIILHAGTVQSEKNRRYPEAFFQAVSEFICKHAETRKKIKLKFIGHIHHRTDLVKLSEEYNISSNVVVAGWINHKAALKEMLKANVLLIIHHSHETIDGLIPTVPAKTYEYFAAQKPILCLSSAGTVGQMVIDQQKGLTVDPLDVTGIINALDQLYFNYQYWGKQVLANDTYMQYEAQQLAKNLAELLPK